MKLEQYIKAVELGFGAGVIQNEISDRYGTFVEEALRQAKEYLKEHRKKTYHWAREVDAKGDHILKVLRWYSASNLDIGVNAANPNAGNEFDVFSGNLWMGRGESMGGIGMNSFARQFGQYSSRQQMANALGHDLEGEYDYETKKLYPISNRPPRYFTIKYVYDFESVEDVHEVDWQNIIIRLAIAIAKINLGQIRTDHIDKGSLWEDNGAEYLERGMNEHDAIIEELKQKGRHPIFKGDK